MRVHEDVCDWLLFFALGVALLGVGKLVGCIAEAL